MDMASIDVRKKMPMYMMAIPTKMRDKAKVLILLILFEYLIDTSLPPTIYPYFGACFSIAYFEWMLKKIAGNEKK